MMHSMKKKAINITLPEDLLKEAKIQAVREDRNFSDIVEALLRDYLDKQKRKGKS